MSSLTVSHPFGAEARESVPVIFWGIILHCGVLVSLGLALMLWGVSVVGVAICSMMLCSFLVSLVVYQVEPQWTPFRGTWFTTRVAVYGAAAGAVVELGGWSGLLLVALCVGLTPGVQRVARRSLASMPAPVSR